MPNRSPLRLAKRPPDDYDHRVPKKAEADWYAGGLSFACTQCGNCCTGPPGYVFLTRDEASKIAEFLGRTDGSLSPAELRRVGPKLSLTEHANGDCVFLKQVDGKRICSVYPVRPLQCRTWPFWDSNLDSPAAWREAARTCPGIDAGRKHEYVQIERIRLARDWKGAER